MVLELGRVRSWNRGTRLAILSAVALSALALLSIAPRVPLASDYHNFADRRPIFGIPHSFDALSNLPFLIVGVWGVVWLLRLPNPRAFLETRERIPYLVFFAGVALTGIGSGYYHLEPGNGRLVWDLLPMTFSFMSMVAALTVERISVRAGLWLLPLLTGLGAASVAYWYRGQIEGHGDLRFYLFVQFFPVVAIGLMMGLFPARYTHTRELKIAFLFYLLAKLFELQDRAIYSYDRIVSGHTLKHLTAGVSCYWILRMLMLRRPAGPPAGEAGETADAAFSAQVPAAGRK